MATYMVDPKNGNDASAGTSWGTAWKTWNSGPTSARIAAGDLIEIARSPAPTDTGQTAVWTNNSKTVTLSSSAVTANIDRCEVNWTGVDTHCTPTLNSTDWREGTYSLNFAVTAGGGLDLYAYHATGTLNLSGYKQVSFWFKSSINLAAGDFQLKLCSDTAGVTAVNTINIPAIFGGANGWAAMTVDTGGALGSSIQSIALYQAVSKGACTLQLDNVLACKDSTSVDSITLSSLISKNTAQQGGSEGWWAIQSINGTTIILDQYTGVQPSYTHNTYGGSTQTVELWKRECFSAINTTGVLVASGQTSTCGLDPQKAGTAASWITIAGGYDTGGGGQVGETFYDGVSNSGVGTYNNYSYVTIDHVSWVRFRRNVYVGVSYQKYTNIQTSGCTEWGFYIVSGNEQTWQGSNIIQCNTGVLNNNAPTGSHNITTVSNIMACDTGFYCDGRNPYQTINNVYFSCNNSLLSMVNGNTTGWIFRGCSSANNTTDFALVGSGELVSCYNCTWSTITLGNAGTDCKVYNQKSGGTAGNHIVTCEGATITLQTGVQQNGSAWDFAVTSSRPRYYPVRFKLLRVLNSVANKAITISVYCKLSSTTNVGGQLIIRANQIGGQSTTTDIVTAIPTSDTSFHAQTISITPNEIGTFDVEGWAWYVAGSGDVYFDSTMTVTQAA